MSTMVVEVFFFLNLSLATTAFNYDKLSIFIFIELITNGGQQSCSPICYER